MSYCLLLVQRISMSWSVYTIYEPVAGIIYNTLEYLYKDYHTCCGQIEEQWKTAIKSKKKEPEKDQQNQPGENDHIVTDDKVDNEAADTKEEELTAKETANIKNDIMQNIATEHKAFVVVDMGGGTLDTTYATLERSIMPVECTGDGLPLCPVYTFRLRAIGGDAVLGGKDFDNCLYDIILDDIQGKQKDFVPDAEQKFELLKKAVTVKESLSRKDTASFVFKSKTPKFNHKVTINRDMVMTDAAMNDLLDRVRECIIDVLPKEELTEEEKKQRKKKRIRSFISSSNTNQQDRKKMIREERKFNTSDIEFAAMVGGSSMSFMVKDTVQKLLPTTKIGSTNESQYAVAYGCAVYGWYRGEYLSVLMVDNVTARDIGVSVFPNGFSPVCIFIYFSFFVYTLYNCHLVCYILF